MPSTGRLELAPVTRRPRRRLALRPVDHVLSVGSAPPVVGPSALVSPARLHRPQSHILFIASTDTADVPPELPPSHNGAVSRLDAFV
jgi:hypothetical protein